MSKKLISLALAALTALSLLTACSGSGGSPSPDAGGLFTLSAHDLTLLSAGSSQALTYTADPVLDMSPVYASSDESVAVVAEDGTVTAVAPGQAVITAVYGELTDTCVVRCSWEADPVDLAAFARSLADNHPFTSLQRLDPAEETDAEYLNAFYPGLLELELEQAEIYLCIMSLNMGEFALVQARDADGAARAAEIFQARIDYMIQDGAWYPEPTRIWSECSAVVTNGAYVLMVSGEDYQAIQDEFNALF